MGDSHKLIFQPIGAGADQFLKSQFAIEVLSLIFVYSLLQYAQKTVSILD
jgi:hypothetical protein